MADISQFDQSLQKLNVLFKYSGLNMKHKIISASDFIKYRWLFTFNFLWVMSATVASFYYIYIGLIQGKKFIELTSVAPCLTFTILAIFKSFFLLMNEGNIFKLMDILRRLESESTKNNSIEKFSIAKEDRNFLNGVINVLYFINCCMIIVFDMTPLILIGVKYYKTKEFEMLLPYLDVFSFIPYKLKYWPFAYVHQIWSECIVLLEMGAADYLFFTCCTYIKIQFKLLKYDIEKLIPIKSNSTEDSDESVQEKLCKLVKWHQDLIESTNILEIIYNKSTLFNFLSSSLVICLTGFNVTIVDDITVIITFVTFLMGGLMQVFFLCFFADMLTTASMEVSSAVYNSQWFQTTNKNGKQLLFIQTRSQTPCKLTAAGFADVNLRAFMRVLSTSWSYFALLQTVYKEKV